MYVRLNFFSYLQFLFYLIAPGNPKVLFQKVTHLRNIRKQRNSLIVLSSLFQSARTMAWMLGVLISWVLLVQHASNCTMETFIFRRIVLQFIKLCKTLATIVAFCVLKLILGMTNFNPSNSGLRLFSTKDISFFPYF